MALLVTVGTLTLHHSFLRLCPKGFFPVEDTGLILGVSEAPQNYFVSPQWPSGNKLSPT